MNNLHKKINKLCKYLLSQFYIVLPLKLFLLIQKRAWFNAFSINERKITI